MIIITLNEIITYQNSYFKLVKELQLVYNNLLNQKKWCFTLSAWD